MKPPLQLLHTPLPPASIYQLRLKPQEVPPKLDRKVGIRLKEPSGTSNWVGNGANNLKSEGKYVEKHNGG